jgi:hypothetical protein
MTTKFDYKQDVWFIDTNGSIQKQMVDSIEIGYMGTEYKIYQQKEHYYEYNLFSTKKELLEFVIKQLDE